MKKPSRNFQENHYLSEFLTHSESLSKFVRVIGENGYMDLINNISYSLKYENVPQYKIIYRKGDRADKFYIILSGVVVSLIYNEIKMTLTEKEYHSYLFNLRMNDETDMINKCIKANEHIFPVDEDFDIWIRSRFREAEAKKTGRGSLVLDDQYLTNMMRVSHYIVKHNKVFKENLDKNQFFEIETYIKKLKPANPNPFAKEDKKEASIFIYTYGNVYRTGDIFGGYNVESRVYEKRYLLLYY